MKHLRSVIALLTATVMCGTFSGAASVGASAEKLDATAKLSDSLLRE